MSHKQKEELDETMARIDMARIDKAIAGINKCTKEIKKIDEKITWIKTTFNANPYEGSGEYKGD